MQFIFPNNTGTLEEFAAWYKANEYPMRPPFEDPVYVTDNSYSYVLFRQGQFQVEMYLIKPNCGCPEHSHPRVENIILFLGGDARPTHNGVEMNIGGPFVRAAADGTSPIFGAMGPKITDENTHALLTGAKGAAFLSLEKWPEDIKPTSVVVNWQGSPVGDTHMPQIQSLSNLVETIK
jgi:hypothetical protein